MFEKNSGEILNYINMSAITVASELPSIPENLRKAVELIRPKEIPVDCMWVPAILVTTNWNKNDAVFVPEDTLPKAYTILNKPANWQHNGSEDTNSNETIGVVTQYLIVDDNYVPSTLEENKEKYHIIIGILVWKENWPTYAKDIQEQVEKNILFVSMECRNNYNFALREINGSTISDTTYLVERDSTTDWMNKYLRDNGGPGTVQLKNGKMFRIGKWLRNIEFAGVGFVNKPGNSESIIIPDKLTCVNNRCKLAASLGDLVDIVDVDDDEIDKIGVLDNRPPNCEDCDNEVKMNESPELVNEMKTLAEKNEALVSQSTALANELASLKASYESSMKTKDEINASLVTAKEEMAKELAETKAELAKCKDKLMSIEKATIANQRFDKLMTVSAYCEEDRNKAIEDLTEMTEGEFNRLYAMAQSQYQKLTDQTKSNMAKATDQSVTNMDKTTDQTKAAEVVIEVTPEDKNTKEVASEVLVNLANSTSSSNLGAESFKNLLEAMFAKQ